VERVSSVASFFVSRVDTKADAELPSDSPLRGQVAIANAHRAYRLYLRRFDGERWRALQKVGARPQRPLWASTGTKDPTYSDVLYVEHLIASGVINTMPEKTLYAFADHGTIDRTMDAGLDDAGHVLAQAEHAGLDLRRITTQLEREAVQSFCDSYDELLGSIEHKLDVIAAT
jgi:transaldolase